MEYKDIFEVLFDKKEDADLFDLADAELEELDSEVGKKDKELTKFIDTKIHPKCRKKLKQLLLQYNLQFAAYFRRENQLFYKNGISDAVKFIMNSLSIK